MKVKYLSDILAHVAIEDKLYFENLLIKNVTHNSGSLSGDDLFVAVRGYSTDGHNFIKETVNKGAVAAIVEKFIPELEIPQIKVVSSRDVLAQIAVNFYQPELDQMRLVGITGTNGKTTTSYLVKSVMESAGIKCGLIGTISYQVGNKSIKAWNTTPESTDLCKMLYDMHQAGQRDCVLEVSSHALYLKRVSFLRFTAGVFTNLTQDHLDFHKDMEDYFSAKKILFDLTKSSGSAIVNIDDPYGRRISETASQKVTRFGIKEMGDIRLRNWESSINGIHLTYDTQVGKIQINSPLIGEFNVENISAAVATGVALNFKPSSIKAGIEKVKSIPGRLEIIPTNKSVSVVVDYSHTPDALQKALEVLKIITNKRLWVVFGCGGDRDVAKRPIMGNIAKKFADELIVTSDNPRSEEPIAIINDILNGINEKSNVVIEPDRRNAIYKAFSQAEPGDTILIAGKGHEDYQEIKGIKYPFDDREVVRELMQ